MAVVTSMIAKPDRPTKLLQILHFIVPSSCAKSRMKKDKYSGTSYSKVLKYLQASRKRVYLFTALLGAILTSVPIATIAGGPHFSYTSTGYGKSVNAVNNAPNAVFFGNSSAIYFGNGTSLYNFVGTGGNDTFTILAGNDTTQAVLTGMLNNSFIISSGGGNSTFSMVSGDNSTFLITQGNLVGNPYNGTQVFAITGGANSNVTESSLGPVGTTMYSVNLGFNSSVVLSSDFQGNATVVNVVF